MIVSGIGCSSNLPGYINTYGMHTLHGRSLPIAQGFKLANHKMTVVAVGGDGDGYAIGMGHLVHAMRRNVDITYAVMNNAIYGLTTGQASPTSGFGMKTKSTPFGNPEVPVNPLTLALGAGCGFVARVYTGHLARMVEILKEAIEFPGFALVDTFSPCVTFNLVNTPQFFKENCRDINQNGHDPGDIVAAREGAGGKESSRRRRRETAAEPPRARPTRRPAVTGGGLPATSTARRFEPLPRAETAPHPAAWDLASLIRNRRTTPPACSMPRTTRGLTKRSRRSGRQDVVSRHRVAALSAGAGSADATKSVARCDFAAFRALVRRLRDAHRPVQAAHRETSPRSRRGPPGGPDVWFR